jgi:hypothetical protein
MIDIYQIENVFNVNVVGYYYDEKGLFVRLEGEEYYRKLELVGEYPAEPSPNGGLKLQGNKIGKLLDDIME